MKEQERLKIKNVESVQDSEKTTRAGRGRYKSEITQAGALAKKDPRTLMKRLKISRANEKNDIGKLNSIISQAVSGAGAMSDVYGKPEPRQHKTSNKQGLRIPINIIPPRDARMYLIHTLVGAENAGFLNTKQDYQVEILGKDVLIYFSDKTYSWDKKSKEK